MSAIDEYLVTVDKPRQAALERVREIVKKVVPAAEETINYGMPVFKLRGKYVIGMSAFKNHMSVFPGSEPVEALKKDLEAFKTSKGTIQFTVEKPIPEDLLIKVIQHCIK